MTRIRITYAKLTSPPRHLQLSVAVERSVAQSDLHIGVGLLPARDFFSKVHPTLNAVVQPFKMFERFDLRSDAHTTTTLEVVCGALRERP